MAGKKDPSAPLVASQHALGLPLSDEEYLGGVCDCDGRVGRVAVAAATARDRRCGASSRRTSRSWRRRSGLNLPPKLAKKVGPWRWRAQGRAFII